MRTTDEARAASPTSASGDDRQAGIIALFEVHYDELLRTAALLTGDNAVAEELVQEAFVEAWRRWDTLRSTQSAGYLRTVIVNLARRRGRRRQLELRTLRGEQLPPLADGDPDQRVDLRNALAQLPLRKRACVVLRFYSDLPEQEVAAVLGVSVGTVKSQTAKALRSLERYLSPRQGSTRHEPST